MAYSDIGAAVPGATVPASWGDQVRANFQASAPDVFTTKGDLFVATGSDAGDRLAIGANDSILVADSGESVGAAWQIMPACAVYNSAAIPLTNGDWTTLTFDSERFDTDAMHSTSSNTSRLTIPAGGAGWYSLDLNVTISLASGSPGNTDVALRFILDGTTVFKQWKLNNLVAMGDYSLSALYYFSSASYIQSQVYVNPDGGTSSLEITANGNYSPEFRAIWQRR